MRSYEQQERVCEAPIKSSIKATHTNTLHSHLWLICNRRLSAEDWALSDTMHDHTREREFRGDDRKSFLHYVIVCLAVDAIRDWLFVMIS